MISALDTHQLVKGLKASGFTDEQAEAVTRAVRLVQDHDISNLAAKAVLGALGGDLETTITALELRLPKWMIGVAVAGAVANTGALTDVIWTATQILLHSRP